MRLWWLIKRSKTLFKSQKSLKRWHSKIVPWVALLATTHCNLLYAQKIWNCSNFIRKRMSIKLLFIKVRCLINVNKICGLFRNG